MTSLTRSGLNESALALVDQMLSQNKNNKDLWLNRAAICLQENDHKKALISLEVALRLGDTATANTLAAAQLHLQFDNNDRAVELLTSSFKNNSIDMVVLQKSLNWLAQKKMWNHSKRLLSAIEVRTDQLSSQNGSLIAMHLGKVLLASNDVKNALAQLNKAVKLDPTNGWAVFELAELNRREKKFDRSELLYTRAQTFEAVEKYAYIGKAQLYIDLKDYQAGTYSIEKCSKTVS